MKREEKVESVAALREDLGRATVTVLAEYRGLTAGQLDRLRRVLREADGRCRVAKNTLVRRAVASSRHESIAPLLRGPLAVIWGFRDPVAIAKIAVKFADDVPLLQIRGAVLGDTVLQPAGVKALAALPPREVVVAQLLGLLQAPAVQLMRTLNEPAARLARLVDALAGRLRSGDAA